MTIETELERRRPSDGSPNWREGHVLVAFDDRLSLGVVLEVAIRPSCSQVSFAAAVLRPGEEPIVLAEDDIRAPDDRWEIRASGLWADHVCETPLEHWSYGLEAFALQVASADELLTTAVGDRVPLGWELEFEADREPVATGTGYQQVGRVHGLLLTAAGETELAAIGARVHWWGSDPELRVELGYRPGGFDATALLPSAGTVRRIRLGVTGASMTTG